MKYYRTDFEYNGVHHKIGISCGYDTPTEDFLNNQVHEYLKSQEVTINRNETFNFQDSNEKEFYELKHELVSNPNFKVRY